MMLHLLMYFCHFSIVNDSVNETWFLSNYAMHFIVAKWLIRTLCWEARVTANTVLKWGFKIQIKFCSCIKFLGWTLNGRTVGAFKAKVAPGEIFIASWKINVVQRTFLQNYICCLLPVCLNAALQLSCSASAQCCWCRAVSWESPEGPSLLWGLQGERRGLPAGLWRKEQEPKMPSVPDIYWNSGPDWQGFKLTLISCLGACWGNRRRKQAGTVGRCCSTAGVFFMYTQSLQAEILDWQSAQG